MARSMRRRNPRRDMKREHNPINFHSNKELVYGHSITHSPSYQKGVGITVARREHDKAVRIMRRRGFEHETPFESEV